MAVDAASGLIFGLTLKNGESVTIPYTVTTTGTTASSLGWGTATIVTGGGTWYPMEPDMTDWPADDIIDYYAKDLARRRPASPEERWLLGLGDITSGPGRA